MCITSKAIYHSDYFENPVLKSKLPRLIYKELKKKNLDMKKTNHQVKKNRM